MSGFYSSPQAAIKHAVLAFSCAAVLFVVMLGVGVYWLLRSWS